jgi:hypothetical protein
MRASYRHQPAATLAATSPWPGALQPAATVAKQLVAAAPGAPQARPAVPTRAEQGALSLQPELARARLASAALAQAPQASPQHLR